MKRLSQIIVACITLILLQHIAFPASDIAYADSTGYKTATTILAARGADWTNLDRTTIEDDVYATAVYNGANATSILNLEIDFGTIPDNAVIDNVNFRFKGYHTGGKNSGGGPCLAGVVGDQEGRATTGALCFSRLTTSNTMYEKLGVTFSSPGLTAQNVNNKEVKWGIDISLGPNGVNYHDYFAVNINYTIPAPTPTLTPFLDLPWDYEGKGLSFNEGALAINSYFDHEYPLLSSGLSEPASASGTIVSYLGFPRVDKPYSMHDGYDYGRIAQARIGNLVLATASGSATYVNTCNACGNAIHIDHGNGYQTRYYHLQKDGLIATVSGQPVLVESRQAIGKVGFSGNVLPKGENGAHIHFMVVQDKDEDGDFDNNTPDGMTDPYGWQSDDKDPWEDYPFVYNGGDKTGNRSYYLWINPLDGLNANFSSNGGVFSAGHYTVSIPEGATTQSLTLKMQASPIVKANDSLVSIGSAMNITAKDTLDNSTALFIEPLIVTIDFAQFDLSRFKSNTLSIYSSADNINWVKEASFIDQLNKKATTEVSHLTYFALMAERADTIAPTTTAILDGQQGEQNWFRSNVTVNLSAQDNENGLGVDYTLYKIEGVDWEQYSTPLLFVDEGHHKIEFYSVDKDENIEEIKSIEFDIDKTKPEVEIHTDLKTIWPPNGKMVDITITGTISDENPYVTTILVEDEYDLVEPSITTFETEINQTIQLEAFRREEDKEGRIYTIKILATDLAGNTSLETLEVIVPHDQRK